LIVVERKGNWLIVEGHAGYAPKGFDIVCEAGQCISSDLKGVLYRTYKGQT